MKCPNCGEKIFQLTKEGNEALKEIGYPIKSKAGGEEMNDLEYPAKLKRIKGYWFIESEIGTIDLGDCEDDLNIVSDIEDVTKEAKE